LVKGHIVWMERLRVDSLYGLLLSSIVFEALERTWTEYFHYFIFYLLISDVLRQNIVKMIFHQTTLCKLKSKIV